MGNCFGKEYDSGGLQVDTSRRSFSRRLGPWEKTGMVAFRNSNLRVRSGVRRGAAIGGHPDGWAHLNCSQTVLPAFPPPLTPCAPSLAPQEFPKQVEEIAKKVMVLDGTGNKIKDVPQYVGLMVGCHRLGLSKNRIGELPESIGSMISLRVLLLDCNRLRCVPPALFLRKAAGGSARTGDPSTSPAKCCSLPMG